MARTVNAQVEARLPGPLRARLAQAKARPRLKAPVYMKESARGVPEQVLCKVCGAPIAGLIVHDQPLETVRGDGKVVIRERLVWAKFSNYAEMLLTFADGSQHMTPLSTDCAATLTQEQADDCYTADMQDLLERPGAERIDWARWQKTVTRWERVE